MMQLLDLFSGIGGFSLRLERSGGFKTVAFCEIDPFCRRVLAKHWPGVPIYDDVRSLTAERLHADGIAVDAICGGFPCQDISTANINAVGLAGERSGPWSEYARLVGELRPRYVIVENVAALLGRGLDKVLGDLAALGFDAEWSCVRAADVGAPHVRDRVWLVAYPDGQGKHDGSLDAKMASLPTVGNFDGKGLAFPQAHHDRQEIISPTAIERAAWWDAEPDVVRVVHGVPARVDRLRALGNAVVPQIPELIGRSILAAEVP